MEYIETVNPSATRNRAVLAFMCCAALFLYAVYFGALGVLLPIVGRGFRVSPGAVGRLFPAEFVGFVVGVLCSGYMSDRAGRKVVLLVGIGLYALGLATFGKAPIFALALPACTLIGIGTGAIETVACAMVCDLYPDRRAVVLNGVQVAFGLGAASSPALAYHLIRSGVDWRILILALAVATLSIFVALALQSAPAGTVGAETVDFARLCAILRQPAFLALCLSEALYVGAECSFFSWMPTYVQRSPTGCAALAGSVVTVFWVTMTIGRVITGGVVSRVPLLRLNILLATGGAAAAAFTLLATTPLAIMLGVGLTGLCFSGIFGIVLAEAGERYPAAAGTVFGGVVAAGGIGGAVFPWIVGVVGDSPLGWRFGLTVVPVLIGALALLTGRLRRI